MKKFCFIALIGALAFAGCYHAPDDAPDEGWTAAYAIGDTGPGGGIVFYVSAAGFGPGNAWHYLEAATADMGTTLRWSTVTAAPYINIPGTETGIGTGAANTDKILAVGADPTAPAALACKNYNGGGKNDWFLPSKDELNEMYTNRTAIGGFIITGAAYYWSSSQHSTANEAYMWNFSSGNSAYGTKITAWNVRAVRAF